MANTLKITSNLTYVKMIQRLTRGFNCFRQIRQLCSIPPNCVTVEHLGSITSIGINNPSKKNCLNTKIIQLLKDAFKDFDESDSEVAVIYGENGTFCSGFDINEVLEKGYAHFENLTEGWREGPLCRKPIICALSGYAVAEGFELALACDLRVIEETAAMGFLGRRFGAPLALGGAKRLYSLLGGSRALDLLCTGRLIQGNTAREWGLAARYVSTGTAFGQSLSLATSVQKFPSNCLQYDKLNAIRDTIQNEHLKKEIDDAILELKKSVYNEAEENLPKFLQGIGKHGKFKNIKVKKIPHWDSMEDSNDLIEKEGEKI